MTKLFWVYYAHRQDWTNWDKRVENTKLSPCTIHPLQEKYCCKPDYGARTISWSKCVRLLRVNKIEGAKDHLKKGSVVGEKTDIRFCKIRTVCGIKMTFQLSLPTHLTGSSIWKYDQLHKKHSQLQKSLWVNICLFYFRHKNLTSTFQPLSQKGTAYPSINLPLTFFSSPLLNQEPKFTTSPFKKGSNRHLWKPRISVSWTENI